jgi:hypothetical protein
VDTPHLRMLGRWTYGPMIRKRKGLQTSVFQVFGNSGNHSPEAILIPRPVSTHRKGDPLNADIRTITDALQAKGVFDLATLIDPESIVNVALSLASMPNANEYALWLGFYAARYEVSTDALATDALIVLAHAGEYVNAAIAKAAQSQVKQLAMV